MTVLNLSTEVFKRRFRPVREIAIAAGAYGAYLIGRHLFIPDAENLAINNALKVVALEQALGLFYEIHWQGWALNTGKEVIVFFNWMYMLAFWPIMVPVAVVTYLRSWEWYRYYRNVVLMTCAVAFPFFLIFPVAPPRMFPAFVDTIPVFGPIFYYDSRGAAFYNALASTPSLHLGWSLLVGTLFFRSRRTWLRVMGVMFPTLHFLAIIFTGNHYFLDAVAGFSLATVCLLLYEGYLRGRRRLQERRQARHEATQQPA